MSHRDRRIVFATDCEGPAVRNDNALETASLTIPDGLRLFEQLSKFDDYTARVRHRPAYNIGDTLRLLAPFLKAYDVTDASLTDLIQQRRLAWIPDAKVNISNLRKERIPVFQITVSYRPFAKHVARLLGVRSEFVYCTPFALDKYTMSNPEVKRLKQIASVIADLPKIPELPPNDTRHMKLPKAFRDIEHLVWGEMAEHLPCSSKMLREIRTMGGQNKVNAVDDIAARTHVEPRYLFFLGDSITDVEVLEDVDRKGGVAISFNGDSHAVNAARYCCWGNSALVTGLLALIVKRQGGHSLRKFVESRGDRRTVAGDSSLINVYDTLSRKAWGVAHRDSVPLAERVGESKKYRMLNRGTLKGFKNP